MSMLRRSMFFTLTRLEGGGNGTRDAVMFAAVNEFRTMRNGGPAHYLAPRLILASHRFLSNFLLLPICILKWTST